MRTVDLVPNPSGANVELNERLRKVEAQTESYGKARKASRGDTGALPREIGESNGWMRDGKEKKLDCLQCWWKITRDSLFIYSICEVTNCFVERTVKVPVYGNLVSKLRVKRRFGLSSPHSIGEQLQSTQESEWTRKLLPLECPDLWATAAATTGSLLLLLLLLASS